MQKVLNTIIKSNSIVYRGTKQLYSDIRLKCVSLFMPPIFISLRTGQLLFYSFHCVFIIEHFTKCFKIKRKYWTITMTQGMMRITFENWFVSILRLKSEWIYHLWSLIFVYGFLFWSWFLETADVFSAFIMIVLISSMLYLASIVFQLDLVRNSLKITCFVIKIKILLFIELLNVFKISLFAFHQQMRHPDFGMITIFLAVPLGTSLLFVYCYLGKMSTESHLKMSDCLYECSWLSLSCKLQKYLIVMIENAQRPIYYHGFDVAVLNLETFSKVRKNGLDFTLR